MPVTAVVIAGNTVFGYAPDKKTDPEEAAKAYQKYSGRKQNVKNHRKDIK